MKISLIASSVRHHLWIECFDSLKLNDIEFEVVFVGELDAYQIRPYKGKYPFLKYIHTGHIKPAQCYEVARRAATGELIMWGADDCEFSEGLLDQVYEYWHSLSNPKAVISVKTNENHSNNDLDNHRILDGNKNTPLMAPLGVMNREYLQSLGGFDRRYLCGQYENDVVMRVLSDGGKVYKYEDGCVSIEHLIKHGPQTKFWKGYGHDRMVLEDCWIKGGYQPAPRYHKVWTVSGISFFQPIDNREVVFENQLGFEGYEDRDILTKSQSFKGEWD